jgi:hypothetical protein
MIRQPATAEAIAIVSFTDDVNRPCYLPTCRDNPPSSQCLRRRVNAADPQTAAARSCADAQDRAAPPNRGPHQSPAFGRLHRVSRKKQLRKSSPQHVENTVPRGDHRLGATGPRIHGC